MALHRQGQPPYRDLDRSLRTTLKGRNTVPIIPGRRNRKRLVRYDERQYKDRWRVEAMFCRPKGFRRNATRYDRLASNDLSAVQLAATVAFRLRIGPNLGSHSGNRIKLGKMIEFKLLKLPNRPLP